MVGGEVKQIAAVVHCHPHSRDGVVFGGCNFCAVIIDLIQPAEEEQFGVGGVILCPIPAIDFSYPNAITVIEEFPVLGDCGRSSTCPSCDLLNLGEPVFNIVAVPPQLVNLILLVPLVTSFHVAIFVVGIVFGDLYSSFS